MVHRLVLIRSKGFGATRSSFILGAVRSSRYVDLVTTLLFPAWSVCLTLNAYVPSG